jgi:3-phosphoglycerate kinase
MIINLEELELGGKKVLIRQDLNVPIKAGLTLYRATTVRH